MLLSNERLLNSQFMKQTIFLSCLIIFSLTIFAQKNVNQASKKIEIGYLNTFEKLPKLKFTKINENEFLRYKPARKLIKQKIEETKTRFYLDIKSKRTEFKKEINKEYGNRNGTSWFEYIGFYPALKLYAITSNSVTENLGFGELSLINKETGFNYQIISIGDGSVETPNPSTNNKYLVYFYNHVYEPNHCFVGVLKINNGNKPQNFITEYKSYETKDWAVEQLIWIDDQTFVLKAYTKKYQDGQWSKEFDYYQTKITD